MHALDRSTRRSILRQPLARLAVLAGATLLSGCTQWELLSLYRANNGSEHRLSQALPIELPFRHERGWILLQGSVNGAAPIEFVLDTGASVIALIDGPDSAHLGLDLRGAHRFGSEDNLAAPFGARQDGLSLRFGALELREQTALAIPLPSLNCRGSDVAPPKVPFAGVIGYDLLHRFVVEVDYDREVLTLHDPERYEYRGEGRSVAFDLNRRQPFLRSEVSTADGQRFPAYLHVDSGAEIDLTLFPRTDPAIPLPAEGKETSACFVGGLARYRAGEAVQLALDGAATQSTPVQYALGDEVIDGEQNGRLGARFLSRFNLLIDYPGERMILQPRASATAAAP